MRISYSVLMLAVAAMAVPMLETLPFANSVSWAANFSSIDGYWRGKGNLKLEDGSSEKLRCKAYYNPKDGGRKLGMAVRCASTSYKLDFRSKLALNGDKVSGSWEERNFNASGKIAGAFQPGNISLSASGGVEAKMSVQYTKTTQTFIMDGNFGSFKGLTLNFTRK